MSTPAKLRESITAAISAGQPHEKDGETTLAGHAARLALELDERLRHDRTKGTEFVSLAQVIKIIDDTCPSVAAANRHNGTRSRRHACEVIEHAVRHLTVERLP